MSNADFGKALENVRKQRVIKFVTTETVRNYLVSELNYHPKKIFSENLLTIEIKKNAIFMNKPVYFGISIL